MSDDLTNAITILAQSITLLMAQMAVYVKLKNWVSQKINKLKKELTEHINKCNGKVV